MHTNVLFTRVVAIVFLTSVIAAGQSSAPVISITAQRMLDVERGSLIPDAVVIVEGERIVAAGPEPRRHRAGRRSTSVT